MKKLFFFYFISLFFNFINAGNINESNFLEFLSEKNYFSADFLQTTFKDNKGRKIHGEIKANRKGMFKVIYQEPLNEIIFPKLNIWSMDIRSFFFFLVYTAI